VRFLKILLEDYEKTQGINELYRIVSKNSFEYIESFNEYCEGLLLYSRLFSNGYKTYAESSFYINGKLVETSLEDIEGINVYINNEKKRKDVALKKSILRTMKLDHKLPWGILTGIRPSKIVHKLIDMDLGEEEITKVLRNEYLLREDKLELLMDTCIRQRNYLEESKGKYSIYIGIPFCPTRCLYCSFPALNINENRDFIRKYIDTLIYELREVKRMMKSRTLNTVYIGGGTPTSLKIEELREIILEVKNLFSAIEEFTVEAGRPDTLSYDYLKMLKEEGVDRISINPQTMNDKTLKLIGRRHSSKDIVKIYKLAKDLGIDEINMDLIIGLPGEKFEDIQHTMEEIKKLSPSNLTVHSLAIKTGSRFSKTIEDYQLMDTKEAEEVYSLVGTYMEEMGLKPYYLYRQKNQVGNLENIGYSRESSFCKYNISMMEERETIVGVGIGSVSKLVSIDGGLKRLPNFKGLNDYITRIDDLILRKEKYLSKSHLVK